LEPPRVQFGDGADEALLQFRLGCHVAHAT
jgi:hypothetical protein